MAAGELSAARKEQIKQKYIQSRRRKTVLPLWYHAVWIVVVAVLIGASAWWYRELGLAHDIIGRFNVQVILGIVATIVMVAITAYAWRKKFPGKYLGMLTYWLGAHVYMSVLVVVLVVLHAGLVFFGGLLNILLMWSFLLVIASGVFGFLVYKLGAKLLARVEGEGKLAEDIVERRKGLNREVLELSHASSESFKELLRSAVLPSIVSFGFLMRQYLKREPLPALIGQVTKQLEADIARMSGEEQTNMCRVIEDLVTVRRLDAEYLLHQLLRLWLPAHVALTAAMWLVIVIHVGVVLYY